MRVIGIWGIALAAAFGIAAPAQAATVVGSSLTASDLASSDDCASGGECTQWNNVLPGATLTTPAGVVTAFTVRSATAIQARIRILRGPEATTTIVSSTAYASIPGTNTAHEVDARVSVNAGDVVAISFPAVTDQPYAAAGGASGRCFNRFAPEPADGATAAAEPCTSGRELLYNATVEADADGDGYGDESQDLCSTNPGPGACPVPDPVPDPVPPAQPAAPPASPDATAPVLTGVAMSNKVFRVSKSSVGALGDTPRGTAFRFSLSERATVTMVIEQQSPGRRVNGDCRKQTSENRKRQRCVRYVRVRTFARSATAGQNSVAFGGHVRVGNGSRALRPARYRALMTARDATGNASAERQTAFRVVE